MTIRGLFILFFILILIPVFMGRVSVNEFVVLLRNPTGVALQQWKYAGKNVLKNVYGFYIDWGMSMYHKFRPDIEKKLKEYEIDEALEENKKFIEGSLEILKGFEE